MSNTQGVIRECVRALNCYRTGVSFFTISTLKLKGHAVLRLRDKFPLAFTEAGWASVKRILSVVDCELVVLPVQRELPFCYPVRVPAHC